MLGGAALGALVALVAAALVAFVALAVVPWRVGLSLQAHGDPGGAWAVAGGAQLLGCAASVAQARGAPLVLELRAFGRRVLFRALGASPAPARPRPPRSDYLRRLARRVDPVDLAFFLAGERRRLAVRNLEGIVELGLHDVALAGQVAGALAVLSALGAPFGRLRHRDRLVRPGAPRRRPLVLASILPGAPRLGYHALRRAEPPRPREDLNMADKLTGIVKNLLDGMHAISQTDTIVGEPTQVGNATVIPVHRLRVGFMAGGLDAGGRAVGGEGKTGGRGVGGSAQIDPVAVLAIGPDGRPRMLAVDGDDRGTWQSLIKESPELRLAAGEAPRRAARDAARRGAGHRRGADAAPAELPAAGTKAQDP